LAAIVAGAAADAIAIGEDETLSVPGKLREADAAADRTRPEGAWELRPERSRDTAISCQRFGVWRIGISPPTMFMVFCSAAAR
jgi:hypothetical protein